MPAVERIYFSEQIYESEYWSEFKFAELVEICRVDPAEVAMPRPTVSVMHAPYAPPRCVQVEFTGLLSRARLGHQHLTERDKELLTARICRNHCSECTHYRDVMQIRPPGEPRSVRIASVAAPLAMLRAAAPAHHDTGAGGRRSQEETMEADVHHCPPRPGACVLAARRHKVDHINRQHAAALHAAGTSMSYAEATDTENGRPVTNEDLRARIDNKRSNYVRSLPLHIGMLVIVTINKVPRVA